MLAFFFTSYDFRCSRVLTGGVADNCHYLMFIERRALNNVISAHKNECISMHARLVYYVFSGKSRGFSLIF